MKLVTYRRHEGRTPRFGFLHTVFVVDVLRAAIWIHNTFGEQQYLEIPATLAGALEDWERNLYRLKGLRDDLLAHNLPGLQAGGYPVAQKADSLEFLPPVPEPMTIRAFDATLARSGGKDFPGFYYTHPRTLYGHRQEIPIPPSTSRLDLELELAAVIGRETSGHASSALIAGYTIANDWTDRDRLQTESEHRLGPSLSKDFATSLGPGLVTSDELADTLDAAGNPVLDWSCRVNDTIIGQGRTGAYQVAFADLMAAAGRDVALLPGDHFLCGHPGFGGESSDTGLRLQAGDRISLEVERLGILENILR